MAPALDPGASPLVDATEVSLASGDLRTGLPWGDVARRVAGWSADPGVCRDRRDAERCEAGFELSVDAHGRATAAVADQASAGRLAAVMATAGDVAEVGVPSRSVRTIRSRPVVGERAALECFYGPLWSAEARTAVIQRVARHGATTYVYGPAADERTGRSWREPYAHDAAADLERLFHDAHMAGMDVVWRVSPGAPLDRARAMSLGDPDELDLLLRRIFDVLDLGADRVLLAFDDIRSGLDAPSRAVYGSDRHPLAAAHAAVMNAVHAALGDRGVSMLACPTHYWGVRTSSYRQRFGELLAPEVPVCWTGGAVISSSITAEDASTVAEQFQHPVWLWDNVPVNDWDGADGSHTNEMRPRRLPLMAVGGRQPELADVVVGYGANAALQPHAGLPAVCTALDWAWSPRTYDADRALRHALAETGEDVGALLDLADAAGPTLGAADRRGRLAAACAEVFVSHGAGAGAGAGAGGPSSGLRPLLERYGGSARALRANPSALARELEPWTARLADGAEGALVALDVLDSCGTDHPAVDEAVPRLRSSVERRRRSEDVVVASGLLDGLVDFAYGLAGGGAPTLPDGH